MRSAPLVHLGRSVVGLVACSRESPSFFLFLPTQMSEAALEQTEWVQCEQCVKWRALPSSVKADALSDQWVCELATWCTLTCSMGEKAYTKLMAKAKPKKSSAKGVKRKRSPSVATARGDGGAGAKGGAVTAAPSPAAAGAAVKLKSAKRAKKPKKPKKPKKEASAAEAKTSSKASKPKANAKVEVQWVQCDSCAAWRIVPPSIDANELPDRWHCEMNTWDSKRASCSAAEEVAPVAAEEHGSGASAGASRNSSAASGSGGSGDGASESSRGHWTDLRASHYKSGAHRRSNDKPKCGLGLVMARIFTASSVYQATIHSGIKKREKESRALAERILPSQPELEWRIALEAPKATSGDGAGKNVYLAACSALATARRVESAKEAHRQIIARMLARQPMTHKQLQAACYRNLKHDTSVRLEELLQQGRIEVVPSSVEDDVGLPFYRTTKHSAESVGSVYTAIPLKAFKPWNRRG